ncbi:helix-turn-helix transcriptional regulator [Mycolicibacterium sp. S2-37]|uniref:helix-turn-helix transcriptional regulator n=1 Tax=Mycolicibacterium sp. S2-37 TaxID=2810297 RepID=UPI001A93CEDF|nr:helix-turn-helix transcriptional regulator [Mycolicibacterium sp. S2-37]MBO0680283.1 helix-turn-helix transcriptional regulator [Mycolicibacterium sp. S2-37]
MSSSLLRPRDADALRAELRGVAAATGLPVTFGGEVHDGTLLLSEFFGTRTAAMRGLVVRPSAGLGGASLVAHRPLSVADYRRAVSITHDYDGPVLGEGIRAVLAVPVVVDGRARAVLYGAHRTAAPIGGRIAEAMVASAGRLSVELRVRDEVERRLRLREAERAGAGAAGVEQIREVHAELRLLATQSSDGHRLRDLADRLAQALSGDPPDTTTLTPRELDVLVQVAMGCTNAETAQRLALKPETVKSYLRSAGAKLGSRTRHEAVSKARRARLIP